MIPIWKDTYYETSADTLVYQIMNYDSVGEYDEVLFTGKAYKAPGADTLKVKVNDICSNYMQTILPITETDLSGGTVYAVQSFFGYGPAIEPNKRFVLLVDGESAATYQFKWDYSYENLVSFITFELTRPYIINNHSTPGMFVFRTYEAFELLNTSYTNDKNRYADYGYDSGYCGDYAIYYANRYGGWSSFLVETPVKESDEFAQEDYLTGRDNNYQLQRANTRFYNEITHKWEIKSGWLNDNSSKMLAKHLLSSNNVWLHNLKTNKMVPVIITDTTVEYKTFNNERKLFGYTINLEESNKKVIK